MNKIKYKLRILYSIMHKPTIIRFYEHENRFIEFYIITNPKPILKLYCHDYNILYEHGINYIINNKIGKYDTITTGYQTYTTVVFFNIIDKELLLQLL